MLPLIAAILFVLILFASILVHSFLQIRSLKKELNESQEEVVEVLKKRFDIPRDEEDFDDVVESAERAVVKEENVWFPFSAQSQFLKYLLELFSLDQEGLGLEVERISIDKGVMTLKARVKDYDSVIALEKILEKDPPIACSFDFTEWAWEIADLNKSDECSLFLLEIFYDSNDYFSREMNKSRIKKERS